MNFKSLDELFDDIKDLPDYVNENYLSFNYNNITIIGCIYDIRNNSKYPKVYIDLKSNNNNENKLNCCCDKTKKNIIKQLQINKSFIFKGDLLFRKKYYNNDYEFSFIIKELLNDTSNISYIENLINECNNLKLFDNKKIINWNNIKTIALLSKQDTHGYNDFITLLNKFNNPINIKLFEIVLEGKQTEPSLITTINDINNNCNNIDIILILRGGGDTNNISLSFDKLNIFNCIKQSKIPICLRRILSSFKRWIYPSVLLLVILMILIINY